MSVLNQFVAIIFTILLVASQSQLATARGSGHGNSSRSCKASPGSAAWPSERAWAELDQSLGGRLLRPPPPGAVCHPGQPTFDAEQCTVVTAAWHTYDFHSNDPISK